MTLIEQGIKIERILGIYSRLCDGYLVKKEEEADRYAVSVRTIQRDINNIVGYINKTTVDSGFINEIKYNYLEKGYRLEKVSRMNLSNSEILAICKILLDSRAFTKEEMMPMIDKLLECCVPRKNHKVVTELIANEKYHYVELKHGVPFIERLWDLGTAIKESRYINVKYTKIRDNGIVTRKLKPVGIMFSEFYFYLTAYIENIDKKTVFTNQFDEYPTIYRIDRIKEYESTDEHFKIPYSDRFEEGEFRKRVQFMYGGNLKIIKFKFTGYDIDSILDRLPTAKIISGDDTGWVVQAEVFGDGIDMWLRSQGNNIIIL